MQSHKQNSWFALYPPSPPSQFTQHKYQMIWECFRSQYFPFLAPVEAQCNKISRCSSGPESSFEGPGGPEEKATCCAVF